MDCETVRRALVSDRALDDAERAHADRCELCASLLSDGGRTGRRLTSATEVAGAPVGFEPVLAAIESETGPVAWLRQQKTSVRLLVTLGVALALTTGTLLFSSRADLEVYPLGRALLATTTLALALAIAVRLSVWPSHLRLPSDKAVTAMALGAVFVPLALAAMPEAHWGHPAAMQGVGADFAQRALGCFALGAALGLPLLAALFAVDRGIGKTQVIVLGAAGLGLMGNLALQLHCPLTHPAHLVFGHAGIAMVAVPLAALVIWMKRR